MAEEHIEIDGKFVGVSIVVITCILLLGWLFAEKGGNTILIDSSVAPTSKADQSSEIEASPTPESDGIEYFDTNSDFESLEKEIDGI